MISYRNTSQNITVFLSMMHYYCDVEWMWPCTKCSRLV